MMRTPSKSDTEGKNCCLRRESIRGLPVHSKLFTLMTEV